MALPAVLEQPLLGEFLLGVDDQDLCRRIGLIQNMGHHRNPLVGPRRAAERVGRRDHAIDAALRHGLDLRLQKLGLRAGLVGVRHAVLLRQVPPRNGPRPEVDARREDEAVVGEAAPARQPHAPRVAVDGDRPVVYDVDPMTCGEGAVAVADRREVAEAAEIEVREEAAVVGAARFHERYIHSALRILGDVARGRGAARAAAHNDDARAPLCEHRRRRERRRRHSRRREEMASAQTAFSVSLVHDAFPLVHGSSSTLWKYAARAAISSSDKRPATSCMTGWTLFPRL